MDETQRNISDKIKHQISKKLIDCNLGVWQLWIKNNFCQSVNTNFIIKQIYFPLQLLATCFGLLLKPP